MLRCRRIPSQSKAKTSTAGNRSATSHPRWSRQANGVVPEKGIHHAGMRLDQARTIAESTTNSVNLHVDRGGILSSGLVSDHVRLNTRFTRYSPSLCVFLVSRGSNPGESSHKSCLFLYHVSEGDASWNQRHACLIQATTRKHCDQRRHRRHCDQDPT